MVNSQNHYRKRYSYYGTYLNIFDFDGDVPAIRRFVQFVQSITVPTRCFVWLHHAAEDLSRSFCIKQNNDTEVERKHKEELCVLPTPEIYVRTADQSRRLAL